MGFYRDYLYDTTKVTAICPDTNNGNFLWVAFSQSDGNCILLKVSATDPNQIYFTIQVPVTCINALVISNGYIFLAVTHATYFAFAYSLATPLTSFLTLNKPTGVTESPIANAVDPSGDVYFLTPGIATGTVATVVETNDALGLIYVIALNQEDIFVNNASAIAVDSLLNIWIVTKNSPSFLVRVWQSSFGWQFQETNLI